MSNKCEGHCIDSIQFDKHLLSNYYMLIGAIGTDCDMFPDRDVFIILNGKSFIGKIY